MNILIRLYVFFSLLLIGANSFAAGILTPVNQQAPSPQIQQQHVNVVVENSYAITTVEQMFYNPHNQDLEATYSFPVPEKASVSELTLWIDGKPVIGEVLPKKQARIIHQQEKAAGRETALTEQKQHYRFETHVSPIRAQQETKIRLVYIQPTHIDTSIGRYVYPLAEGETDDQALSFWENDATVHEQFSFNMQIRSGYPISGVRLPKHSQAQVQQLSAQEWQISFANHTVPTAANEGEPSNETLEQSAANPANKPHAFQLNEDIVVYWRLADDLPAAVDLTSYRAANKERGTFMLTLTPANDLGVITQGRDYAFVLDMSGSMAGKYATLVDGVNRAIQKLQPNDRFRIFRFDDHASELTKRWVNATPESVQQWSQQLTQTTVGGGTNLYAGLERALDALDSDRSSSIVLVTDGEANVGTTEKSQFLKLMQQHDVRLFTAVMGNGANRPLLEQMTKVSNGFAVSVSNSDDIAGKILEFTSKAKHQALHDLQLRIDGVKTADISPKTLASLYRGQQLVVMGHYWGDGAATITLSGKLAGETKHYQTQINFPKQDTLHPELERLWAFASIEALQEEMTYFAEEDASDRQQAITDLAVEYGLVTDYTSMLVMREEQFEQHGIERNNKQRRDTETQAAQQRQNQAVSSSRADTAQPMFSGSRSSYSGGGSGGGAFGQLELLLLTLGLLLVGFSRRKHKVNKQLAD